MSSSTKSRLLGNAGWIMFSTIAASAAGFGFWLLAARRNDTSQIGAASAVTALIPFIATLGGLGLGPAVTRALHHSPNQRRLVWFSVAAAFIAGLLAGLLLATFHPALTSASLQTRSAIALVSGLLAASTVATSVIIASGSASLLLFETFTGAAVRLGVLFAFPGKQSVLNASLAGMALAALTSLVVVATLVKPRKGHGAAFAGSIHFAGVNWIASAVSLIPAAILPTMVYARAGANVAAAAAVAAMFLPILNLPASTLARSLFAEGSRHPERVPGLVRTSAKFMTAAAVLVLVVTTIGASPLLRLFGDEYRANGQILLRLLALSALVATGNYLADTILLLRHNTTAFLVLNITGTLLISAISWFAAARGASALGAGWVIGQLSYSVVALAVLKILSISSPKTAPSIQLSPVN